MNEIWVETYEKMDQADRTRLTRCIHALMGHTFLLSDIYDDNEKVMKGSSDYRLVDRYFEWVQTYLEIAGWTLLRNRNLGVIYLESQFGSDRARLNQVATILLLAIRLLYDEEREKLTIQKEITLTTEEVIGRLLSFGTFQKKPSDMDLTDAFRALSRYNLIQRIEGEWKEAECRFLVFPSIALALDGNVIKRIYDSISSSVADEETMTLTDDIEDGGMEEDNP